MFIGIINLYAIIYTSMWMYANQQLTLLSEQWSIYRDIGVKVGSQA